MYVDIEFGQAPGAADSVDVGSLVNVLENEVNRNHC